MNKNELIEEINYMKDGQYEELYRITTSSLLTCLKSIICFGINSEQSNECIKTLKDMRRILKEEKKLLNIILNNIDNIDLDKASNIVDILDELNDNTYTSYDDILNNINYCCELKDKERIFKSNNKIDSLITNNSYKEKVLTLTKKTH